MVGKFKPAGKSVWILTRCIISYLTAGYLLAYGVGTLSQRPGWQVVVVVRGSV